MLFLVAMFFVATHIIHRMDINALQHLIEKRTQDRITSHEVMRLIDVHGQTPHAGAQPRE